MAVDQTPRQHDMELLVSLLRVVRGAIYRALMACVAVSRPHSAPNNQTHVRSHRHPRGKLCLLHSAHDTLTPLLTPLLLRS